MKWIVFLAILVFIARSFLKTLSSGRLLKIQRLHLGAAPAFDPGLVDCYVRFQGRVESPNAFDTPLRRRACVFFQSRVFAEWQTKEKKPKKGLATHRKTLYRQESPAQPIKLANTLGEVYVDYSLLAVEKGAANRLNQAKVKSFICPEVCRDQADAKYKTYVATEQWLKQGDAVTIFGKLVKQADGQLRLISPGHAHFPDVVLVDSAYKGAGAKGLLAEADQKIASRKRQLVVLSVFFMVAVVLSITVLI